MRRRLLLSMACIALASAGAARAQTIEEQLRNQLRSVTTQLREAQSSQATLEAQKAQAEKERDAARARGASAGPSRRQQAEIASLKADVERLTAQVEELTRDNEQAQADIGKFREANSQLTAQEGQLQAERQALQTALAQRQELLKACQAKNAKALEAAKDILAAYRRLGLGERLLAREPVTGLGRIHIEQIEQDLGDRIYDSQCLPDIAAAPPPNR